MKWQNCKPFSVTRKSPRTLPGTGRPSLWPTSRKRLYKALGIVSLKQNNHWQNRSHPHWDHHWDIGRQEGRKLERKSLINKYAKHEKSRIGIQEMGHTGLVPSANRTPKSVMIGKTSLIGAPTFVLHLSRQIQRLRFILPVQERNIRS